MENPIIILYIALGLLGAFLIATIVRTILCKKPSETKSDFVKPKLDREKLVNELSLAVQEETVSLKDQSEDGSKFLRYQELLEKLYPNALGVAEKTNINKYSVIYKVDGSDKNLLPLAILAHQDVVPAPKEGWEVDPFSGAVVDNYIYGRGSQDMKSQMIAALHAMDKLIAEGFKPKRSVYFCFGHDEELTGYHGARNIVEYLKSKNIRFEMVIDEGGTILDGKIMMIDKKIALIGTCEKGYADIMLEINKPGGHASTPAARTAVGRLSGVIAKLEKHKMPTTLTEPTKEMMKALAPYTPWFLKYFFVNRDIYAPLLKFAFAVISPFTNCLVRTTIAGTQLFGATAPNVLPPKAAANLNCRINTGSSIKETVEYIQKVAGKDFTVTPQTGTHEPSPVSSVTSTAYKALEKTIAEAFEGYVVAPYPFIAASDAKYYYAVSDNVYRFTPFEKTPEDAERIHAINERIDINEFERGTQFFIRLYQNICA